MTGAIFAKGSCTALKWMALLGVVLVLGAGSASAQVTTSLGGTATVREGSSLPITIRLAATRPAATATVTVTVSIASRAGNSASERSPGEVAGAASGPDVFFNDDNASANGMQTTVSFEVVPGTGVYRNSQTIHLQTAEDADAEDEGFTLARTVTDGGVTNSSGAALGGAGSNNVTVIDADPQTYVLTLDSGQTPKEGGGAFTVTATAKPHHRQLEKTVRVHLNHPAYSMDSADQEFTLGVASLTTSPTNAPVTASTRTFSIHPPGADKDRDTDKLVIKLLEQLNSTELDVLEVDVADKNPLPMVEVLIVDDRGVVFNPQPDKVQEGKSVRFAVRPVDDAGDVVRAEEELTVSLMPAEGSTADIRDYSVAPHPIVIDKGDWWSTVVTLTAEEDGVLEAETLMLDATVAGEAANGAATREVMGVLELMIEDDTDKLVRAKSEAEIEKVLSDAKNAGMVGDKFTPGQKIEIRASSLFNVEEDVTVTYTATSDKTDVASTSVSDGVVMVMAQQMEGMAYVTVTAHAKRNMASGVTILDQTDPSEASVRFPVEVMLAELSLTLMGPEGDEMNIVEGRAGGMVKVMANRAVTTKVEVKLMRERSMSDADEMDYEIVPEMITIDAGQMEGSAMVLAKADQDETERMEALVLYAMAGDMMVEGHAKFNIWDASIPALPVVAQFLLTAFLAVGGYRRFRRR